MTLAWLLPNILWTSLILLMVSALAGQSFLAGLGWVLFGSYWFMQSAHYLDIKDYYNVALVAIAGLLCLYMAWLIVVRHSKSQAFAWAGYAAAVCGLIYFPFAQIDALSSWLIGLTTSLTYEALVAFSVPVIQENWNIMSLNGRSVEIILACTAIESIALFAGVIVSVKAPLSRKLVTLAASTITIYLLNVLRNAFVIMAYGWEWFGSDSFYVAHNVIAKIGSTIALLVIAYLVFSLLPELLSIMDQLASEIKHQGGGTA